MARPTGIFKRPPRERVDGNRYAALSKADLFDAFVDLFRETSGDSDAAGIPWAATTVARALADAERRTAVLALADGRAASKYARAALDEAERTELDASRREVRP